MYEIILDSEVDPGSPITHSLMRRLRDNPYAMAGTVAVDGGVSMRAPVRTVVAPPSEWPTDLGSQPFISASHIDQYNEPSVSAQFPIAARGLFSMPITLLVGASNEYGNPDSFPVFLRVTYVDGVPNGMFVKMCDGFFLSIGVARTDPMARMYFTFYGSILVGGEIFIPSGGGMTQILMAERAGMTLAIRLGCVITGRSIRAVVESVKSSNLVGGTIGYVSNRSNLIGVQQ